MLPIYIEEVKRRERKQELFEEVRIEAPSIEGTNDGYADSPEELRKEDRGVAIIDFTI